MYPCWFSFLFSFLFNSRLHSNNLNCDCHLAWLAQWLRQRPTIGLFTQCTSPAELRGLNVAEVQKHEFSCSGKNRDCQRLKKGNLACLLTFSKGWYNSFLEMSYKNVLLYGLHGYVSSKISMPENVLGADILSPLRLFFSTRVFTWQSADSSSGPGQPHSSFQALSCVSSSQELAAVPTNSQPEHKLPLHRHYSWPLTFSLKDYCGFELTVSLLLRVTVWERARESMCMWAWRGMH